MRSRVERQPRRVSGGWYVVHQDVFTKIFAAAVEGTAAIDAGHPIDEVDQLIAVLQHEGVDDDAFLRAATHFF